jgi:hypothetical protein
VPAFYAPYVPHAPSFLYCRAPYVPPPPPRNVQEDSGGKFLSENSGIDLGPAWHPPIIFACNYAQAHKYMPNSHAGRGRREGPEGYALGG